MIEPEICVDPKSLHPMLLGKLRGVLLALRGAGELWALEEAWRSRDRQLWTYGSGRPEMVEFGRPGPVLTDRDGKARWSLYQGLGKPGTALACVLAPRQRGAVAARESVVRLYREATSGGLVGARRIDDTSPKEPRPWTLSLSQSDILICLSGLDERNRNAVHRKLFGKDFPA